jgi:hypothetical protein
MSSVSKQLQNDGSLSLPPKRAKQILERLINNAPFLMGEEFGSPKRSEWTNNARGVLERSFPPNSSIRASFETAQTFAIAGNASRDQLREEANSVLNEELAVLRSAVEQLGWAIEHETDAPQTPSIARAIEQNETTAPTTPTTLPIFVPQIKDRLRKYWPWAKFLIPSIGVLTLVIGFLGAFGQWMAVPEFRRFFRLDKAEAQPAQSTIEHKPEITPPREVKKIFGVLLASREAGRKAHQVVSLPEVASDKTLAEMPDHTFGFLDSSDLRPSKFESMMERRISNEGLDHYFELHKVSSQEFYLIASVGTETQERLREGLVSGDKLTIYTLPWDEAPKLVSLKLDDLNCPRIRQISLTRKDRISFVHAADCEIK